MALWKVAGLCTSLRNTDRLKENLTRDKGTLFAVFQGEIELHIPTS